MCEPLSVRRAEGETCGGGARSAWGEGASQGKLDEVIPQAIYKHIKNRLTKRREGERERQASRTQPKPQRVHALWQGRDSEGGGWSGWQGPVPTADVTPGPTGATRSRVNMSRRADGRCRVSRSRSGFPGASPLTTSGFFLPKVYKVLSCVPQGSPPWL